MCIAVPGKLIEMDGSRGKADIKGNVIPVELGIVQAKIGDYVLVHAGCAIAKVTREESEELDTLLREIGQ